MKAFQSRSGFSECFDTHRPMRESEQPAEFQSRSGFSECFDGVIPESALFGSVFQSRSGFSECFDRP